MSLIATITAQNDLSSLSSELAQRLKKRRKQLKLSRKRLATESGVSYSTIRVFEEKGKISLTNLLLLAKRVNALKEFTLLFKERQYQSLDELRNEEKNR